MCADPASQRVSLRPSSEQDAVPVVGVEPEQLTLELDGKALMCGDPACSTTLAQELSRRLPSFRHGVTLCVLCATVPGHGSESICWPVPGAAWLRYAACFGGASIVGARTARADIVPFTLPFPFDADDERVEFTLMNAGDSDVVAELVLMIDSAYA